MTQYMIIDPSGPHDRRWVDRSDHTAIKLAVFSPVLLVSMPDPGAAFLPSPAIVTAYRRRWKSPGWRVALTFWVVHAPHPGYVMPGCVLGRHLPQTRICWQCRDWGVIRELVSQRGPGELCDAHEREYRIDHRGEHSWSWTRDGNRFDPVPPWYSEANLS